MGLEDLIIKNFNENNYEKVNFHLTTISEHLPKYNAILLYYLQKKYNMGLHAVNIIGLYKDKEDKEYGLSDVFHLRTYNNDKENELYLIASTKDKILNNIDIQITCINEFYIYSSKLDLDKSNNIIILD